MTTDRTRQTRREPGLLALGAIAALGLSLLATGGVQAATVIDGPIDLGTAEQFGVLASSTVTNTGPSVVGGDVGVSPGTSVTGFFPPGTFSGVQHSADAVAGDAQTDLATAYGVAAGLTPTTTGLGDLSGLSLTPGVYRGGELSIAAGQQLTLAGDADSVWVFQAASTLITGSGSRVVVTGEASACNVFWQIGSSATLGSGSTLAGTVMAAQSISATTGATVVGRLLADAGAVTLDSNPITLPADCGAPGTVSETDGPELTSGPPPEGVVGTPYSYQVTATGTPAPAYTVTDGELPAGLELDATTGVISGTPTGDGTSTFTITADNGAGPPATSIVTIVVAAAPPAPPAPPGTPVPPAGPPGPPVSAGPPISELPPTGLSPTSGVLAAVATLLCGALLLGARSIHGRGGPLRRRSGS